jgi:DeoR family transcriptional regulator, glycerol-3-phosphate regulon repressor
MPKNAEKRRDEIIALTRQQKNVSVEALVEKLGVSAQTVRRDINHLCDENLLRRRHGGAERFERPLNVPYDLRAATNPRAKSAIGRAAAKMVPDGATVFISIGSTLMTIAEALGAKSRLTVVTNNLNVAMALSGEATNRIILPGGEMRPRDRDILGEQVVEMFASYRAEFGFFGVAGVAEDGGLLDFHTSEVQVREKIRMNSKTSVLTLDSTKFGRAAPAVGGNIADVDQIILDRRPDGEFGHLLEGLQADLQIVGGGEA